MTTSSTIISVRTFRIQANSVRTVRFLTKVVTGLIQCQRGMMNPFFDQSYLADLVDGVGAKLSDPNLTKLSHSLDHLHSFQVLDLQDRTGS